MKKAFLFLFLVLMFCNNSISDTVFTPQQVRTMNKEKFNEFWKNFGAVIKEGLYEFNEFHEKILPLLRFKTSESNEYWSLDNYINKMNKDQKEIFYFANVDKDHIKNSPQLETFLEKKIPFLYLLYKMKSSVEIERIHEYHIRPLLKINSMNIQILVLHTSASCRG